MQTQPIPAVRDKWGVEELARKRFALTAVAYVALSVAVARHEAREFAPVRRAAPRQVVTPKAAPAPSDVPINTSSLAQLASLPGVGPRIASQIVAYRDEHGGFRSLDELDNVPGIGPRLLQRILACVSLGPLSALRDSGVDEPRDP
ncbi:MAG: hypothetical protein RL385_6115 [Pseudomonadota bacterium]